MLTRGVSDPARRACADPDAREAGSLGPAGTRRRPTEMRTPAQVSAAVRLRNQWVSRGDDRPCTSAIIIPMVDGAIALTLKATEAQLLHTIVPHPTVSETMRESMLAALGRVMHV